MILMLSLVNGYFMINDAKQLRQAYGYLPAAYR